MILKVPEMLFPSAGVELSPLLLLFLGFTVGVCSGFFGLGGGFMVTPGLNIFGLPISFSVGTSLAQIMGTSIIATAKHRKLGHVDFKLGLILAFGTIPGIELGKNMLLWWDRQGHAESLVRYLYIALFVGLSLFIILDYLRSASSMKKGQPSGSVFLARLAGRIQGLRTRPIMSLPKSGIYCISLWVPLALGLFVGIAAGVLGLGGGFILMPILIYLIGIPVKMAIGTQLFTAIVAGAYGSFSYALANRVELLAVIFMLVGASAGAQIGTIATRYVSGARILFFFALTVLLTGFSIALKQASTFPELAYLSDLSTFLLLAVAGGMSLVITGLFVIERLREARARESVK